MLYNLIIMDDKAGINLVHIKLNESGIDDLTSQLASGMVKAIRDLLTELKMGTIKSFETHEKQILVSKQDPILAALIVDIEDDIDPLTNKLKEITKLFSENVDWDTWNGNTARLDPLKQKAKEIIKLQDEEIIEHLEEHMTDFMKTNSQIFGFKIINQGKVVKEDLSNISDFEIKTFLSSNMFPMISENVTELEKILGESNIKGDIAQTYVDYQKFSILYRHIRSHIILLTIIPGMLDPIVDLPEYQSILQEIGGF